MKVPAGQMGLCLHRPGSSSTSGHQPGPLRGRRLAWHVLCAFVPRGKRLFWLTENIKEAEFF